MVNRYGEMTCKGLATHLVEGMFTIEVRYYSSDGFHCEPGLTVKGLQLFYAEWRVTYITIENCALVVGIWKDDAH